MRKGFNNLKTGVLAGTIGPFIGFFLYYLAQWRHLDFLVFAQKVQNAPSVQGPVLALSLLFNLALFFLFLKTNRDYSARGVLLATFLYVPVMFYLKFCN